MLYVKGNLKMWVMLRSLLRWSCRLTLDTPNPSSSKTKGVASLFQSGLHLQLCDCETVESADTIPHEVKLPDVQKKHDSRWELFGFVTISIRMEKCTSGHVAIFPEQFLKCVVFTNMRKGVLCKLNIKQSCCGYLTRTPNPNPNPDQQTSCTPCITLDQNHILPGMSALNWHP